DDHQPDDGRVPRGRAQPPRSARLDGLLMRRAAAILALLAAGCGQRDDIVSEDRGVTRNQIERLSTPEVENPDPQAPARLQPLKRADVAAAGLVPPVCAFGRDGR